MLASPGRGSEEAFWQHANSSKTHHHPFQSKAPNTLIIIENYNKGSMATLHKYIVRVIQSKVTVLLSTFLQVVRPFKQLLTMTFFKGSVAEKKAEIIYHY